MNRKIGVILSYVSMVLEVLSTLLLTPFIIHTLGQSEFGIYKLSSAITAYLLLLDLGVGNAIIRYIAKYRADGDKQMERKFFGVATIFYGAIGLIAVVIGLVLVKIFPDFFAAGLNKQEIILGQKLLSITMLNCAVTLATSCYNNILIAYEKFAVSRGCSICQVILKMGFTYIALRFGFGSIGMVVVLLFLTVIFRSIMMCYVFFKIRLFPSFSHIETKFIREIVGYSSLVLVQMIATQLNSSVDQILLGRMVAGSAVIIGVYGVGAQVVQYYQSIGSAFTGVLMPGVVQMVERHAGPQEITDEMVRIGRIILMGLALIWGCFLVNGENFIVLWAGEINADGFHVAVILMLAYMFILSESVGSQVLWAMNEHREQSILKLAIVLLNIILTIFLIRWSPLIGATVGTFISLVLGDVGVMNLIFKKKLHMNIGYFYRKLLKGIFPCLLLSILSGYLADYFIGESMLGFGIKVLIMVMVYGIAMLAFGMNDYEKNLLFSILRMKKR